MVFNLVELFWLVFEIKSVLRLVWPGCGSQVDMTYFTLIKKIQTSWTIQPGWKYKNITYKIKKGVGVLRMLHRQCPFFCIWKELSNCDIRLSYKFHSRMIQNDKWNFDTCWAKFSMITKTKFDGIEQNSTELNKNLQT